MVPSEPAPAPNVQDCDVREEPSELSGKQERAAARLPGEWWPADAGQLQHHAIRPKRNRFNKPDELREEAATRVLTGLQRAADGR